MRTLGPQRTLTLLDGHRVVGADLTGAVDVNVLPTNLTSRVDIVTGGASAAWGSDAVAGVINLVLDKNFVGVRGQASYGSSWVNDANGPSVDIAAGAKFAGGRGHILLSAQTQKQKGVPSYADRDWYQGYRAIRNTARTATNGQPGFLGLSNTGVANATSGGVITTGPLAGQQFGPGGTVLPFRTTLVSGVDGIGPDVEDVAPAFALLAATNSQNIFGRLSYDVTDDVNAYVEYGQGWTTGRNTTSHYYRFGNILITADNPFIPAALDLRGQTSFLMGRVQNDDGLGPARVYNKRDTRRIVAGVDGKTDWFNGSFRWNAYYQHGETKQFTTNTHNVYIARFNDAINAVRNPAVGGVPGVAAGTPVCRSTLTNPNNGCIPFNPFGPNSASPAAVQRLVDVQPYLENLIKQDVGAAGFQLEPFSVPAGAVSLAAGVEARRETYSSEVDPIGQRPDIYGFAPFQFGNYKVGQGRYNVKEAFAEVIVPIVKDVQFFKALDFNGAVRLTDYSTSGSVTTWKVGGTWDVDDQLRFRGTRSRDIRAPNLQDLFFGGSSTGTNITVPFTTQSVFLAQSGSGNPNLVPEVADTTSFGLAVRPSFFPGFSGSIDRYKISITDAIVDQTATQVVNGCYGFNTPADPTLCNQIILNANPTAPGLAGQLNGALVRFSGRNIARQDVEGWGIEVGYRRDLSDLNDSLVGSIDLRAIGNHLTKFTSTIAGVTYNTKNMVIGIPGLGTVRPGGPNWRWVVTGNYSVGPSSTTLTLRTVSKTVVNNEPRNSALAVDKNNIASAQYVDITQAWNLTLAGADVQLFAKVENVFDQAPPPVPDSGSSFATSGSSASYFDLLGRMWRVGVRFSY